jgi:hypothetical protein
MVRLETRERGQTNEVAAFAYRPWAASNGGEVLVVVGFYYIYPKAKRVTVPTYPSSSLQHIHTEIATHREGTPPKTAHPAHALPIACLHPTCLESHTDHTLRQ